MKVAVTGGAGFIGRHVVEELDSRGHKVVIVDRNRVRDIDFQHEFYLADVTNENDMTELAAHVDGIIHLAAVLGTQETIKNPRPSAYTNIVGALNVFEAANQYNLPVSYAGVGNHFMRLDATGSYTISKSAAEDYARMFNAYRGGNIAIVRPVNAYGPRQSVAAPYGTSKVRKIMPSLIIRALLGHDIEIYGDGEQISDCVYVQDVAKAFVTSIEHASAGNRPKRVVEVGPARSHTVNEIANMIVELTGSESEIVHLPMRPGEIPGATVSADVETLKQIGLDADEFTNLKDGLSKTIHYYEQYVRSNGLL
jgi:UDP-glucose 4-epimerase